jgi:hypothetical protein
MLRQVKASGRAVSFRHVKGHSGDRWNDRADHLANMGGAGRRGSTPVLGAPGGGGRGGGGGDSGGGDSGGDGGGGGGGPSTGATGQKRARDGGGAAGFADSKRPKQLPKQGARAGADGGCIDLT